MRLRDAGAVLMAKLSTGLFAQNDQWFAGARTIRGTSAAGSSGSSAGPGVGDGGGVRRVRHRHGDAGLDRVAGARNGVSALRPTFGRVSRHGGMVLAWSQDRVGPICRTVEDCAMVFNAIHGADEKDPSTVTTPFRFRRKVELASLRIGVDPNAPPEFVDKLRELGMKPVPIGPRPATVGGGLDVEYAAAFDYYVQRKAKEMGIDLASIPEPQRGGGGAAANPTGMGAITRWTNGRFPRAFDFIQAQRRRHVLITQMAEQLKDLDLYVPTANGDIALHAQTGHPCVVVQYKFDSPPAGRGGGGAGRGGAPDTSGRGVAPAPVTYNPQPICATLTGNLYTDDLILSVAHQYQAATDWHERHPKI